MKKVLLPLFALLLSATVANAQKPQDLLQSSSNTFSNVQQPTNVAKARKAPVKKADELASTQRYVAPDGADNPYRGMGLPGATATKTAVWVSPSILKKYEGAKVVGMRFALYSSIGRSTTCFLTECDGEVIDQNTGKLNASEAYITSAEAEDVQTATISGGQLTNINWNEVTFSTPYTIPADPKGLLYGFEYTQKSTQSGGSYTSACYPWLCGQQTNSAQGYGICCYGQLDKNAPKENAWFAMTQSYVLCAQLLLEKEDGFKKDIEILGLSAPRFVKSGNDINLAFAAKNFGSENVAQSTYAVSIDGKEEYTLTSPQPITWDGVTLNAKVEMPEGLEDGVHTLAIKVKSMEGGEPTGSLDDDSYSTEFRTYSHFIAKHQYQLVEQETSWTCGYCPYGYNMLNALQEKRPDMAWVSIHGDMDSSQPDPYTINDANYLINYSVTGWPTGLFNRYLLVDSQVNPNYALGLGITVVDDTQMDAYTNMYSTILDYSNEDIPAQVRLDLSSNFDAATGKLALTVKGTGVTNAAKVLAGNTLTVYLTENGLSGRQYYYSNLNASNGGAKWVNKYEHPNVLRQIVSQPWGDEITWNGDNFTKTYEVDVDADFYDYENGNTLNAIAFVGNPFVVEIDGKNYFNSAVDNVWVNNCIFQTLNNGEATGIENTVASEGNATVVARYAADGTQVSAPVKGINILKMSDGTTRKVFVNK